MKIIHKILTAMLTCIILSVVGSSGIFYMWHQGHLHSESDSLVAELFLSGLLSIVVTIIFGSIAASRLSRHFVEPLEQLNETARSIANGDFNSQFSLDRKDEIGSLAMSFEKMRQTLDLVLEEMTHVMLAAQEGQLAARGRTDIFSGDWQELMSSVNTVLDALNAPFSVTAASLDRMAKGDIPDRVVDEYKGDFGLMTSNLNTLIDSMNEVTWLAVMIAGGNLDVDARERSEDDRLMKALNMMIVQLKTILTETDDLIESVRDGDLTARGETEELTGGWKKLVCDINSVIDAFVGPILTNATSLDRISRGDIPPKITQEYKGDFNEMKNNLNSMIDTSKGLLHEINGTTRAIREGRLDARIKTENLNGDWKELGEGINHVIEAFVTPIDLTASTVARIAKGDIPEPIAAEYQGDFNDIVHNLNLLIGTIRNVLQEVGGLIQSVQEGNLAQRGDAEAFVGDWQEVIAGINNVIEAFVSPIGMAAGAIERIGRGDLPDLIDDEGYHGDFNQIKQNLNLLIAATNDVRILALDMSEGQLELEVNERSEHDVLMQALNTMIQRTKEVVSHVKNTADAVAFGSEELSTNAEELSQGASQQASAMDQVSSSMEEMAANVHHTAENARQTETIARQAAEYAQEGGQVVTEAVAAMQKIAEKILIVEEIAMQTRLLSLNATIEAARAQEHGKAFSVVASEVRKLADTTKSAAEEIGRLARSSLNVSQKAGQMLATLVPSIHKTSDLVHEISAATNEQSLGINQINHAIQQLDQVTQQNAGTSDEMAATSEALAIQAKQLQDSARFFQLGDSEHEKQSGRDTARRPSPQHALSIDKEATDDLSGLSFSLDNGLQPMESAQPERDERDEEFEHF